MSDTAHFVKLVLEPMVKRNKVPINDGALQYLLSTSIGTDKMVIMDGDGNAYVINEDKGKWEGGVWYSNTSFSWNVDEFKTTTYHGGGTQSYFTRNNQGHAPNASYDSHKNNWRKRFEDNAEDDESYLEFWKRTAKADQNIGECCAALKQTQKLPLLLKESVDDGGNVTIIDVEEVETEKKEKTYGPGTMCDYGWWDEEIEEDIEKIRKNTGCSREQAVLRVFNP